MSVCKNNKFTSINFSVDTHIIVRVSLYERDSKKKFFFCIHTYFSLDFFFYVVILFRLFQSDTVRFRIEWIAPNAIADDVPVVAKSNRVAFSSFTHFSFFSIFLSFFPSTRLFFQPSFFLLCSSFFCQNHDWRFRKKPIQCFSFRIFSIFFFISIHSVFFYFIYLSHSDNINLTKKKEFSFWGRRSIPMDALSSIWSR